MRVSGRENTRIGQSDAGLTTDAPIYLRTDRLLLRRWRPADKDAFARINADPVVMEHFPSALDSTESNAFADRIEAGFDARGYGLWAVELPGEAEFIGFVGLALHDFPAHFTPAVEIGWRLDRDYWGRGFATEAARTAIADGFDRAGLGEIVSFTATTNIRSVAVMQRLGMTHDPADDFDHPRLPVGHHLRRHVLYRLGRANYK
jgi:RimJ/RimL family protein N-acetyltransferase